jgi:hypothetical protein
MGLGGMGSGMGGGGGGDVGANEDASVSGLLLSFRSLLEWKDILLFLEEGSLDLTCLREVWLEALTAKLGAKEAVKLFPLGVGMGTGAGAAGGSGKGVGVGMGVGMGLAGVSPAAAMSASLLQAEPRFQVWYMSICLYVYMLLYFICYYILFFPFYFSFFYFLFFYF